ncbi:hypothetical protein GCK72_021837 [Caenorhabditis remanei]|uniref:PDZ domain-containing protein n=1 Tax=Caenorhabditis remanei TaxID=31234 RepID=E3NRP3_CAERE|nr:hypothetical protein GCK72_021837 [Caenorhabditis remanei]EFO88251.1 hypothetical protein CRE_29280 [Caenorhabditis remanei]KAF1755268.1 hypothetical protein GCK72_021837 [Caenorhabditis remanei]
MSKNCKSAENTDDDRTLAEDDQNDQNSGSMDHRFERITVTLEKVGGKKFGLGIASVHQRILVCKVENDSLVNGVLRYGDQILEINKKEVLTKIDCKKRLMSSLKEKGTVEMLLLRPKTPDAVTMIEQEIQMSQQPSSTAQAKQN